MYIYITTYYHNCLRFSLYISLLLYATYMSQAWKYEDSLEEIWWKCAEMHFNPFTKHSG
jgi:hypothetical protein